MFGLFRKKANYVPKSICHNLYIRGGDFKELKFIVSTEDTKNIKMVLVHGGYRAMEDKEILLENASIKLIL